MFCMNYQIRKAKINECSQIKELQEKVHFKNVSDEEKEKEGFVSLETKISLIRKLSDEIGIIVAISEGKVIGYEMPIGLNNLSESPLLQQVYDDILKLKYDGKKLSEYMVIIEGQICVKKEHGGKGIAKELHQKFMELLKPNYDLIITGVSKNNPRSMHVHLKKMGFSILNKSSDDEGEWYVIIQDLRKLK